ncbi:alpha/beta hydrolase family protein [Catenuloplanes japonicus]|uniref:alpha/beta hydrolase family protein n=1 Tax=Catenuloplanes japonicus TaxID=33876 RepID=UPI00052689E0|nr:alpha/beta hydrolase [Catenuloplanes japonicus]
MELLIDGRLPATLDTPAGPRGAVVVLHGAGEPQRSYFLYAHLARVLPAAGVAVLRYDRRPWKHGDVPFDVQAADAVAAVTEVRRRIGDVPVGLWAWSQGGWPAAEVAATHPDLVAFLVLVAVSGVSPARQMRFGTARQLLLRGYDESVLADLAALRTALEEARRGRMPDAQQVVDRYADRPWFPLAYVPRDLRAGTWDDMDYDPEPVIARVTCPVLLCYGESDEWTPAEDSIAVWERAAATDDLTVSRLPGCTHLPTLGGGSEISADYTRTLSGWVEARLG